MVLCPDATYRYLKNYKVIHDLLLAESTKITLHLTTGQFTSAW